MGLHVILFLLHSGLFWILMSCQVESKSLVYGIWTKDRGSVYISYSEVSFVPLYIATTAEHSLLIQIKFSLCNLAYECDCMRYLIRCRETRPRWIL
jgi:hypothetical protein